MDSVIPPEILKWAREMREVFGPGVTLRKGTKWPGGNSPVRAAPKRERRA